MLIVGIDPDVSKSGVAVRDGKDLLIHSFTLVELFDFLSNYKSDIKKVHVEASWLLPVTIFHAAKTKAIAARIGMNVGANQQIGKEIVKYCEHLCLDTIERKPLRLIWQKGKIGHFEFCQLFKKEFKKSNQEERDAGLLVL